MKKSGLKTGMIVTIRNGNEYVVFINAISNYYASEKNNNVIVNESRNSWLNLNNYRYDLTFEGIHNKEYDIMKVEMPSHPYAFMNLTFERDKRKLLWEREKPVKEMTMEELEKHFGCKVKIVNAE